MILSLPVAAMYQNCYFASLLHCVLLKLLIKSISIELLQYHTLEKYELLSFICL